MRIFILIATLFFMSQNICAEEINFQLINAGSYSATDKQVYIDKSLPSEKWIEIESPKLLSENTVINAEIGTLFGFLYSITSSDNKESLPITVKFNFPGLKDPTKDLPIYHSQLTRELSVGKVQKAIYGVDYDWELIGGEWSISIFYKDRILHKQQFHIVPVRK